MLWRYMRIARRRIVPIGDAKASRGLAVARAATVAVVLDVDVAVVCAVAVAVDAAFDVSPR